ncbi:MAG TPA: hypothetical protein VJA47_05935 [archaeon]|nr:hypothetical protein [archaeon]
MKKLLPILLIISVLFISGCASNQSGTTTSELDIKTRVGAEITSYCAKTKLPPPCEKGDVIVTASPPATVPPTLPSSSVTASPEPTKTGDVIPSSPQPSDSATEGTVVAKFNPQGDLGASFTLEGDDLEYNGLFVRKYGSPDVAGSWGILAYLLIPQGYLGDVGNEFILTTTQGVTYRFRSRGFTTKSVTLEDQYGTQYKVDLNKGETTNCLAPYSGTLQLISKYPVEYIEYNCLSDTGLTTIDQLKIGEPRNTGPIKYYLKNNLQIELKDKLKEGPLTTGPVPVFYIKSGDKILYEVIFRFVDYEMGTVDVFDRDLNDKFTDRESEFIVGGYEIVAS